MMSQCKPFAGLVSAELDALQIRYDQSVQRAVDDLLSLIGFDGLYDIDAALEKSGRSRPHSQFVMLCERFS
eukprot:SAG31_NODE_1129_length_9755_cov_2.095070_12_plen_71_part_00